MEPQTSTGSLDPQVIALSKAIRQQESGGNAALSGKSGEFGAYQFLPATWDEYSKEAGVNVPLKQATLEQQNQVAYNKIKQWKDKGLNPGQIASSWNAGPGEPNAYTGTFSNGKPAVGTNAEGVHYDVPGYATKVAQYYQEYKGKQGVSYNPQPYSNSKPGQFDFSGLSQTATPEDDKSRTGQLQKALDAPNHATEELAQGKVGQAVGDELARGLGIVAPVAGAVTDAAQRGLELIPGVKGLEGLIGKGVGAVANTAPGRAVVGGIQSFSENNPELSKAIGDTATIASAIPVLKGVGAVKGLVGKAVNGATDPVLESVRPRLTGKALAHATRSQGTEKVGAVGRITLKASEEDKAMADAIRQNVPDFNPSAPLTEQLVTVENAVGKLTTELESEVEAAGANRIYSHKELGAYLNRLPVPTIVKGTDVERVYQNVIDKALEIAKENGGKVPTLLKTRKMFDAAVKQEIPKLYDSDATTAMRLAVKNVRTGLTGFLEKNLPEETGLRPKLLTQHHLLNAMDNMAEKASIGPAKEIGTTAFTRFKTKHPIFGGLVNAATRAATVGSGVAGAEHLIP